MRFFAMLGLAVCAVAPIARAQDTLLPDPVRAERLRMQIERRFGDRLKEELGLSDEQTSKVRVTLATIAARRRGMELTERRLRQALAYQLRPGVAANSDSVAKLVESLTSHRVAFAQTFIDEMRELATILNPVQRGQYLMLRDRLMQRAQELQQGRMNPGRPRP
ncbi:MAG TPA: hypothetical protein VGQ69_03745 [Gemmatimonadales bacterium]|nr:hypothetical protein [Gemmatimonadales bacterium]